MVSIKVDPDSFEQDGETPIWGNVWVEGPDAPPFPGGHWNDMVVAFLAQLCVATLRISSMSRPGTESVPFYDGPYELRINRPGDASANLRLEGVETRGAPSRLKGSWDIPLETFAFNVLAVAKAALDACARQGYGGRDVAALASQTKLLEERLGSPTR